MKRRSGQILTLVLLIVVVALAVGLSVASRNITNLRTSTQTEQSQRAFSAAEGGVEDVLSRFNSIPFVGDQATIDLNIGNIQTQVTAIKVATYEQTIELGNVGQIDLEGPPPASGNIKIEWVKSGDASETPAASLEVIIIKETGGVVSQTRLYYPDSAWSANETGSDFSSTNCLGTGYDKCATIDLASHAGAKLLRIKPFWKKTTVKVSGSLPAQFYDITSTATTDIGVTRRVQVTRSSKPQLPAVFDYALFSEGEIIK